MRVVFSGKVFSAGTVWPVDGHVHFHDIGRVAATLDAATANFQVAHGQGGGCFGALLLAQNAGERVFEALRDSPVAGDWTMRLADAEPETLIAMRGDATIVIVCGRQVRADDGLEVLALGTCEDFPDGLPLEEALEVVSRTAALPVIPWGFGKLLGDRGRRAERLLANGDARQLFVGDNGSRLRGLGFPAFIRNSRRRGFRVLPGTDPFPIGRDHRRVGCFGFLADVRLAHSAPWRSLRAWLIDRTESPVPYGRACSLGHFLRIQTGIQAYNRLSRGPSN